MRLREDELAEMDKFYGGRSPADNPRPTIPGRAEAMPLPALQERIMQGRLPGLRHVWDVEVGPHFIPDCDVLPADVQECVVANIAVMACSQYPGSMGADVDPHFLSACSIGRGYRIIYEFIRRYHRLSLYFVRRSPDADDGPLRVASPGPVPEDPDLTEAFEEVVARSYECDMEKEDLRNAINRLCER